MCAFHKLVELRQGKDGEGERLPTPQLRESIYYMVVWNHLCFFPFKYETIWLGIDRGGAVYVVQLKGRNIKANTFLC